MEKLRRRPHRGSRNTDRTRRANFVSVNEQHTANFSVESHSRRVEILRRMFRHYYEVKLIGLRCRDDFFKGAGAVSTEKRVHMHDAFVFDEAVLDFSYHAS